MFAVAELFVLVFVPAALIAAAGWDLASYTIPNFIPVSLVAGFVVFTLTVGMAPSVAGAHVVAGMLGLLIGFALFAAGYAGGGDAKLFAAAALWLGLADFLDFALAAALFGGLLTLLLLSFRSLPMPAFVHSRGWIMRLHDRQAGIPYGVALAAGAFAVFPYSDAFRAGLHGL